jgi:hypothetical protein
MYGILFAQSAEPARLCQLEGLFGNALGLVFGFAGFALFIYLLRGGFSYITSGGDAAKAGAARATITYAIGGLVVVVLSFFVINLIGTFTGADVSNFRVFNGSTGTECDWPPTP